MSAVDRLFAEYRGLARILDESGEPSLRIATEATFQKVLVLSAASYFEMRITEAVLGFVGTAANGSDCVMSLVKAKAVSRQYHTYFDWDKKNANRFFSMFGTDFKGHVTEVVRQDEELEAGIQAFLKIGRERNRVVHADFGSCEVAETTEEIMALYRSACVFVDRVAILLESVCRASEGEEREGAGSSILRLEN